MKVVISVRHQNRGFEIHPNQGSRQCVAILCFHSWPRRLENGRYTLIF